MGRTFFRSSKSIKDAIVGFAPIPKPKGVITTASGTTVAPAVITFSGTFVLGTVIAVGYTTNIGSGLVTLPALSHGETDPSVIADLVAIYIDLESELSGSGVGNTTEVLASGTATTVTIDSVTITR